MGESYVRPVTRAREPRPEWVARWRFRLVALVLLALATLTVVYAYNWLTGATREDPSLDSRGPAVVRLR